MGTHGNNEGLGVGGIYLSKRQPHRAVVMSSAESWQVIRWAERSVCRYIFLSILIAEGERSQPCVLGCPPSPPFPIFWSLDSHVALKE